MKKGFLIVTLSLLLSSAVFASGVPEGIAGVKNASISPYAVANEGIHHSTYGWVLKEGVKNDNGTVTVTIMEVPTFEAKEYTCVTNLDGDAYKSSVTGISRADGLTGFGAPVGPMGPAALLVKNAFIEVLFNANNECIDFELIEQSRVAQMDSASYGGELTSTGGGAGNMVAQGWVLAKNAKDGTITIGDGNHYTNIFEQTYTLDPNVKVYVVDNPSTSGVSKYNDDGDWGLVKEGNFGDIKVTKKTNGEIYYTPERWMAVCVFDSNYQTTWENGTAKVKELYLFAKPTSMKKSDMYEPDGMQYSGTSWYPLKSRAVEETQHGYAGSALPIEFMKDRLYAIGDIYTSVMLLVSDDGTLSCLDMGNNTSSYQYYLNIEKLGYDPRDVDNIFLTHGHGDHYGAMYEFSKMIRRAGNLNYTGWINTYSQNGGTFVGEDGKSYKMEGTLSDPSVLYTCNGLMEWDTWSDFLGLGINTYIWSGLGHSTDVGCFVFKMKAKNGDVYFNEGDVVTFLYFGGYAVRPETSVGAMRLALINSLQYEANVIVPWAAAQSDFVFPLTQHTNQVSMLEIAKASQIAGIPFMEGYNGGAEEIGNYCENRIAIQFYQSFHDAYENNYSDNLSNIMRAAGLDVPQLNYKLLPAATGGVYVEGNRGTKSLDSVEDHGPFKRPGGEYTIKVKSVNVVHGFDAFMNKNPKFADQTNVYGFTLDKGFPILWDSWTHDPEGWYVQVMADVADSYDGGVDYKTNWYGENYTTNVDGKGERATSWASGPVELCIPTQGSYEFLRTTRLDSKEKAIEFAKALTNGAYSEPYAVLNVEGENLYNYGDTLNHATSDYGISAEETASYVVTLDKASQIIPGNSFEETFRK